MSGGQARGTGPGPSRFPLMLRRWSNVLLALSVATLVAAVIGVQLGRSAIAEINPVHFQGIAAPPRAIDPRALHSPADAFASAYDWRAGQAARAYACGGDCDAHEVRQAAVVAMEPARLQRAGGPYWRDETPTAEPAAWAPGKTGSAQLSVERYLHYPVEEEAPEAAEVAVADKVVPDADEPGEDE